LSEAEAVLFINVTANRNKRARVIDVGLPDFGKWKPNLLIFKITSLMIL
jgi:hypothetical protein